MKLFVTALVVLALITSFCIYAAYATTDILDELLENLQMASIESEEVPENSLKVSENLLNLWEEKFFTISMFLPHNHLDDIKRSLISYNSYSSTGEYAEWREAHVKLEEALNHLKDLIKATANNIL